MLFAWNHTFWPPQNFLTPPKFLGWLRHCTETNLLRRLFERRQWQATSLTGSSRTKFLAALLISHYVFTEANRFRLVVRFLADSNNSWNVTGTPNLRPVRQMLKSTDPADFCQSSCTAYRTFFQLGYSKAQVPSFLFSSLWQHDRAKYNVFLPTATENLFVAKIFFGQNISISPQNIACSWTYVYDYLQKSRVFKNKTSLAQLKISDFWKYLFPQDLSS